MNSNTLSYWKKTAGKAVYPRLESSIETDILIIGGGITGITCAYCLAREGMRPVLIEAAGICGGTTGNTTGKLTIQHNIIYSHILKKHGQGFARQYDESQSAALEFVKKQVEEKSIDCQHANSTAYVYASSGSDLSAVEKEFETAVNLGIAADFIKTPEFPAGNSGMVGFENQAVFHPVRYVNALAALAASMGAKIYCGTKAVKIDDGDIKTVHCENDIAVKAKHLVMATQYPVYDGPNIFFTRLNAKRAYGVAVTAMRDWPDGSYINVGKPTRSVRTHVENGKRVLIVAGESHATGRGEEDMERHYESLLEFAGEIAGVDEVLARWSAQDYDTPDRIPYIGRISDNSSIYVASGFGKWGMTNGTLAGMMISELIKDGNCRYEELYSRNRADYSSSIGKTIAGVMAPIGELIRSKFEGTESIRNLKPGEGRVINFNGEKAGIYRGPDDEVIVLDITCTHMGTELNFNSAEKTWDCPAHGGRFAADGRLLEGPPKDPLRILFRGRYSDLA